MLRILTIFIIAPTLLCAQGAPTQTEEEILRNPSAPFRTGPVGITGVQQDGLDHRSIVQTEDSYVRVQQSGEANLLEATQRGANGQLRIQQDGTNNQYQGTVTGDNNRLDIAQRGEDNLIQQDLIGNDLRYRVTQEGVGHELIQTEHDPLAPAYEVHQQGEGMQITIEQGFVGLPSREPQP